MALFSDSLSRVLRILRVILILLALLTVVDLVVITTLGKNASATFNTVREQVAAPAPARPPATTAKPVQEPALPATNEATPP